MKTILFSLVLIAFSPLAFAQTAELSCESEKIVDGWIGTPTHQKLTFRGLVESDDAISDAQLSGAYLSDKRNLSRDEKFQPTFPAYQNMNRYGVLEDAWCWFQPLIQQDMSTFADGETFAAYVLVRCEGGKKPTIKMTCSLRWEH